MNKQESAPSYFIGFLLLSIALFGYASYQLLFGSGVLQWFMLTVINGLMALYIFQRMRKRMEAVKNMRLLFSAMWLTALLLLGGIWFVQGAKTVTPALLIIASVVIWFIMMFIDRPKA